METLTGNVIEKDSLKEAIRLINEKKKAMKRVSDTRKASPTPISGLDALLVNQVSFYDDVNRFTLKTNGWPTSWRSGTPTASGSATRASRGLMFSGCPMAIPNWKLHSIIESTGVPWWPRRKLHRLPGTSPTWSSPRATPWTASWRRSGIDTTTSRA